MCGVGAAVVRGPCLVEYVGVCRRAHGCQRVRNTSCESIVCVLRVAGCGVYGAVCVCVMPVVSCVVCVVCVVLCVCVFCVRYGVHRTLCDGARDVTMMCV